MIGPNLECYIIDEVIEVDDVDSAKIFVAPVIQDNKLGLSCAKLRASFGLLGFDSVWSVWYSRFG